MTLFDWLIVFALNVGAIVYGLFLSRGTRSSRQWFLGGRALPWYAVGLSMYATNVDNADLVSITGTSFREGLHILSVHTIGSAIAGVLVAFWIVPKFYRAGLFTNSEYLEARFGTSSRVLSALIQIQYRTSMLGLMIWSIYRLLTTMVDLPDGAAWLLIVVLAAFAALYTAWGGLRSVVLTDSIQAIVMMAATVVIFAAVWQGAGGWTGVVETLEASAAVDPKSGVPIAALPHVSAYHGASGDTSPVLIVVAWIIVAGGYWTVNHTQTMRLMGARSLWDVKMAAILGTAISMPIMIASASLGVFGRALFPEFDPPDGMYPHLAQTFLGVGWRGLVVAGILAAAISTFDSMGSALAAVFTRDVYARILVRRRDDSHYVRVGRITTVIVLALGFAYIPFVRSKDTMLEAFLTLIPVFVTPLFTLYLAGVFTRAHRSSGLIGLVCGSVYGLIALADRELTSVDWFGTWFTGRWPAYLWSMLITALSMALTTALRGRNRGELDLASDDGSWLARSRQGLPPPREHPFDGRVPAWLRPELYAVALVVTASYLVFVVFW